ncbi:hypothetical protein [Nannocystis pusilla]|uniref:hypothetical protein n=1 Tax=Nannocystis pusilla TaxID=889268 RepID=UPI003DA3B45E
MAVHIGPQRKAWFIVGEVQRLVLHAGGRSLVVDPAPALALRPGSAVLCWCVNNDPGGAGGVVVFATVRMPGDPSERPALISVDAAGRTTRHRLGAPFPAAIGEPLRITRDDRGTWWLQATNGGVAFDDALAVVAAFSGAGVALPGGYWFAWREGPTCTDVAGASFTLESASEFVAGTLLVVAPGHHPQKAHVLALEGDAPLDPSVVPLATAALLAVDTADRRVHLVDNLVWPVTRYGRSRSSDGEHPKLISHMPMRSFGFGTEGLVVLEHAPPVCVVHHWPRLPRAGAVRAKFDRVDDLAAAELAYHRAEWAVRHGARYDPLWQPLLQRLALPAYPPAQDAAAAAMLATARPLR